MARERFEHLLAPEPASASATKEASRLSLAFGE
jgi:hypothetical protein